MAARTKPDPATVYIKYIGPLGSVIVPALGAVTIHAGAGVAVPAELAASLLEQPTNWARARGSESEPQAAEEED